MASVANSWWMYLLGVLVFVFVLFTSVAFILRSLHQAKQLGMDKSVIRKTVFTSLVFSLLPSISILIGVITLSGSLGIPLPWIRLSVIGALHYEETAALVGSGGGSVMPKLSTLDAQTFVNIASVMTIFILSGPIFCLIAFKSYDKKLLSKAKSKDGVEKKEKKSFSPYLFSAAFIALISSFLAEGIAKLKNIGGEGLSPVDTYTPTIVILVAFGSMALFDLIQKKTKAKWLNDFALGFSMILGMTSAVIVQVIAK